ncbi:mechanosensitive ion channel domain-containing protein [Oceaniglobus trochenteri]|uniref:mechanosensitive ion channel domain-containing protein n=1 Tax=Oceaniglobus trochenteri TaxID=2763260 RepID=UPI001CFF5997
MFAKFLAICLVALVSLAAPIHAQSGEEPAGQTPSQTLIDILQDDTARAELIEQLKAAAPQAEAPPAEETKTVAQQVVSEVSAVISGARDVVERTLSEIARVVELVGQVHVAEFSLQPEAVTLLLVIAAVVAVSVLGKLALDRVIRRNRINALTPLRRRVFLIVLYAVLRLLTLALSWGAGYATTLLRQTGGSGPSTTEAIFLTTVLVFGLCRIALRVIVTPDAEHEPSLSNLAPRAQESVYRGLRGFIAALTFSFMFALPLVREWIGFATVRPVRTLLATILLVMAILMLRRIVKVLDIAHAAQETDQEGTGAMLSRGVQATWRAIWPPLATIYVIYCWLIAVTRPREMSDLVLGGTLYSIGALVLALIALWLIRIASTLHIDLPGAIDRAMPDLAARVSSVARMLCGIVAAMAIVAALVVGIAAWGLIDAVTWMNDPDVQQVFWRIVSAALLAVVLALVWALIASFVDQRLRGATLIENNRARTLLGLFRNAFTILVLVLGSMVVLSQLGIDIAPLLAGAGVIGLAIGFGAQKLVQDIITGVFIQLENAINEGDVVSVAGISGGVEKLSIRSVRLRAIDGSVHIVPFSSVDTVTNLTRDFSFHVAEVGVAYKEKVPEVIAAMQAAFDTLREGPAGADILDDFEMHGVTALGDSSVVVRARIKTKPGKQWGLGRQYTALVKEEFDARGIEIPFPHRQLMLPPELIKSLSQKPGDDAKVIDNDSSNDSDRDGNSAQD